MTHLPLRLAGIALTALVLFTIDLNQRDALHGLILPLLLAGGAYLITQSIMAVALAVLTLSAANAQLAAEHWLEAYAYPALALVSGLTCLSLLIIRFRARVHATRKERWAHRQ